MTPWNRIVRLVGVMCALAAGAWLLVGCGGGGGGGTSNQKKTISLAVTSDPAGAQIIVNGTNTGQLTPATVTVEVTTGTPVQVTVRLAGYQDKTVTVSADTQNVPAGALVKAVPPAVPPYTISGKVLLQSGASTTPATGATITATNKDTNEVFTGEFDGDSTRAGVYYIFTTPGTFTVTATKSGYQSQSSDVTVISGEDRKTGINFTLHP